MTEAIGDYVAKYISKNTRRIVLFYDFQHVLCFNTFEVDNTNVC